MMLTSALVLLVIAQPQGTLGKTDAQIIAMGRDAWLRFHSSKAGESTAATCDAHATYGQVLFRRNAALEKKVPKTRRDLISMFRIDLVAYCNSLIEVSASFSGGGTVWGPVSAAVSSYVEETLYGVLTKKPGAKPVTPASVSSALNLIKSEINKNRKALDDFKGSGYGAAFAAERLTGASNVFGRISQNAKKLDSASANRVLGFCLARAKNTLEEAKYTDVP